MEDERIIRLKLELLKKGVYEKLNQIRKEILESGAAENGGKSQPDRIGLYPDRLHKPVSKLETHKRAFRRYNYARAPVNYAIHRGKK